MNRGDVRTRPPYSHLTPLPIQSLMTTSSSLNRATWRERTCSPRAEILHQQRGLCNYDFWICADMHHGTQVDVHAGRRGPAHSVLRVPEYAYTESTARYLLRSPDAQLSRCEYDEQRQHTCQHYQLKA
jgi:hypothetical protein